MSGVQKLEEIYSELQVAREQGQLSPDGAKLLKVIESGQLTPDALGAGLAGLSMNFSDEAIGSLRGIFGSDAQAVSKATGMTPVESGKALERFGQQRYMEDSPVKAIGFETAGAMIPALLTRGRTAPESGAMMIGKAGAAGLVGGYGGTEQDKFGEQMQESAIMGGVSAVAQPVIKGLGSAVGQGYRAATEAIFKSPNRMGTEAARALVREAIENDVGSIDEAVALLLNKSGKQYSLADIGPNSRAYLEAANMFPSAGKQEAKMFLEARERGTLGRLTSDIQEAFGSKASFFDEFNALKTARSELGSKLYTRALKRQIPVSEQFTGLLKRPSMMQAFERAKSIAAENGVDLPDVFIQNGKLMTKAGEVTAVDTKLLHYMKMGLDDLVFTGKSPTSGIGSTQLNSIKDTRAKFLNYIDSNNKTYKIARDYWAADTAAMDAMTAGRSLNKLDPDQLAADLKVMSKSEKEAFRLGAMQQLMDDIGGAQIGDTLVSPVGDVARNMLKDPRKVRLLRMTFPEGDVGEVKFLKFVDNLKDEIEIKTTAKSVLQGSPTAPRQAAMGRIKSQADFGVSGGSPTEWLMSMLGRSQQPRADARMTGTVNELSRLLTTTGQDPKALARAVGQIGQTRATDVANQTFFGLPPALVNAATSPYAVGSVAGSFTPEVNQTAQGLLGMFGNRQGQ